MTKAELLTKLRAATAPSRELDVDIAKFFGKEHGPKEWIEGRSICEIEEMASLYTNSIDDALTLLQDGWDWGFDWFEEDGRIAYVRRADITRENMHNALHEATGATPALALCIAVVEATGNEND